MPNNSTPYLPPLLSHIVADHLKLLHLSLAELSKGPRTLSRSRREHHTANRVHQDPLEPLQADHSWTSPQREASRRRLESDPKVGEARREVFEKTLAFYATVMEHGCALGKAAPETITAHFADDDAEAPRAPRTTARAHCKGRLVIRRDEHNHSFIQSVFLCPLPPH